jgi:hypothetical protein
VFYRRIWNIVGKYSILCCDSYVLRTQWLAKFEVVFRCHFYKS